MFFFFKNISDFIVVHGVFFYHPHVIQSSYLKCITLNFKNKKLYGYLKWHFNCFERTNLTLRIYQCTLYVVSTVRQQNDRSTILLKFTRRFLSDASPKSLYAILNSAEMVHLLLHYFVSLKRKLHIFYYYTLFLSDFEKKLEILIILIQVFCL